MVQFEQTNLGLKELELGFLFVCIWVSSNNSYIEKANSDFHADHHHHDYPNPDLGLVVKWLLLTPDSHGTKSVINNFNMKYTVNFILSKH